MRWCISKFRLLRSSNWILRLGALPWPHRNVMIKQWSQLPCSRLTLIPFCSWCRRVITNIMLSFHSVKYSTVPNIYKVIFLIPDLISFISSLIQYSVITFSYNWLNMIDLGPLVWEDQKIIGQKSCNDLSGVKFLSPFNNYQTECIIQK